MQNRVFIPQATLDERIVDGTVELQNGVLTVVSEGRRYELEEAVRVLREVSGAGDAGQFVGRVKTLAALEHEGAEIVETSMLVGDAAYDVEPGWVGLPVGSFSEYLASRPAKTARPRGAPAAPKTDEELLRRCLAKAD
jgi:hypothetical protein